ncbi:Stp1/IreP family PP2C-type Ser/Thr phosphatase [Clostridium sp. DL1XJH146]
MKANVHEHKLGKIAYLSDKGSVRINNQDYLGVLEKENYIVLAVADGLGGHNAGEIASKLAIDQTFASIKKNEEKYLCEEILVTAFTKSNKEIFRLSKDDKKLDGMGTTLTLSVVNENNIIIAHVGDSSCYFIKNGEILKITKDHSLVQELVDLGIITYEQAQVHPQKNVITRALGISDDVEIDTFKFDLKEITHVFLCSDGLSNVVNDEMILDTILQNNIADACELLYKKAINNGSRDNISIMIFEGEC